MNIGKYRRVVAKTLQPKEVKIGLKHLTKTNQRASVFFTANGLAFAGMDLLLSAEPYLLGEQYTDAVRASVTANLRHTGFYLVLMAKLLKVKTPTSTKKVKISGARGTALVTFARMSKDVLQYITLGFTAVPFHEVEKEVVNPSDGTKLTKGVMVLDEVAADEIYEDTTIKLKHVITSMVDLYWRMHFDLTGEAPDTSFAASVEMLKGDSKYPEGFFDSILAESDEDSENKDESEVAVGELVEAD